MPRFVGSRFAFLLRVAVSFGFVENYLGDAFKFTAKSKHTLDTSVRLVGDESRQEVDDHVHQLDVGASPRIIRILQNISK